MKELRPPLPAKPKGMSEVQYTYAVALACYQTAKDAADKRIRFIYDNLDVTDTEDQFQEKLDAVGDEHVKIWAETQLLELEKMLREAEEALLKWAEHEIRKNSHTHPRSTEVLAVFADPRARVGKARETLLDICFKFHFNESIPSPERLDDNCPYCGGSRKLEYHGRCQQVDLH